jgi:hypothetical protein
LAAYEARKIRALARASGSESALVRVRHAKRQSIGVAPPSDPTADRETIGKCGRRSVDLQGNGLTLLPQIGTPAAKLSSSEHLGRGR